MNRLSFGDNLQWLRDTKEFPDASVAETYHHFIDTCPNVAVVAMMEAFHSFLKNLVALHRILKESASLLPRNG